LRFGRFLAFTTNVVNSESLPNNLTERRFRSFWERFGRFLNFTPMSVNSESLPNDLTEGHFANIGIVLKAMSAFASARW
jgi:hypothetical protein